MILLFLLLANGLVAHYGPPAVGERGSPDEHGPALPDGRAPALTMDSSWLERLISYSDERSTQIPTLEPDLARVLAEASDEEHVRVIVYLEQRSRIPKASRSALGAARARTEWVSRLKDTASRAQASLRSYLEEQQAAGLVSAYEPFWITNAVAVEARPAVVHELATYPSVAIVALDHWRQWVREDALSAGSSPDRSNPTWDQAISNGQGSESVEWNVSRVRADEVWGALGVSGTGVIVAGMDTGVDWFHPALRSNYQSYNPHGPSDHTYSWFDATGAGAVYPVDDNGHGTHTLGTAVGGEGIGIAPGARWIAVKALDNRGYGYDSWIHAGFQWILAPGGDPSKAPDVVNCSWGNDNAYLTTFQDDLRAVRAAGILAVFSNGNGGQESGSVSSPASLPGVFAVGAVDEYDAVATFSARGPSPWGEIRPHVVAPGVHIQSSMPGGAYGLDRGTSMAAPHVSGVAALLRSISPTLSITQTARVITSTALPLGGEIPNNDSGWGLVDAFSAAARVARAGIITGTVSGSSVLDATVSHPIAAATVTARLHGGGGGGADKTAADGTYCLALAPGTYDLTASAFGFQSATHWRIPVAAGTHVVGDFVLTPQPTGSLDVQVTDAQSNELITATVAISGTPYEVTTHTCSFELPASTYTVRAERLGYRVVTATAQITVGETTALEMILPRAPSILLVDSGAWYYESQIHYFREALDSLSYAHAEWSVRDLQHDVPSAADLTPYDIVIWSAPRDAPGYIGAGEAVAEYLRRGGRLFLTGQDVGFWDGGGSGYGWSPYYKDYLKVGFVDDEAPADVLVGEARDIFHGQAITIAGPGGADNQDYPDVIAVRDSDAAAPVLRYQGDGCGGARVGTCLGYRALYFPFGFEGIDDRGGRREIMERSLDWLTASPPRAGLELQPSTQLRIGSPGSLVTHTLRLRHIGQAGLTDQVEFTLEGEAWKTALSDHSLAVAPCDSAIIGISVTIPITATPDLRNVITVTAGSSLSPTVTASATLVTKAPAPVLLVDDDRWYDQQTTYRRAMEKTGLTYDVWETSLVGGGHDQGPALETLQRYPVVVWWTGYDWYAPVTEREKASLGAYLDAGGRLMLSSQDFLYYHHDESFARRHLGVLTYTEAITPTLLSGVSENPIGAHLGPWTLVYPPGYQNWSDGVVPERGVSVAFRDQNRQGLALARRAGRQATLFLAFPFEALPSGEQGTTMQRSIGWLSWLGSSTFDVDPRSPNLGDTVTYTLTIRNDGMKVASALLSNTLPIEVEADPASFAGPGVYDPARDLLSWRGAVGPGQTVTMSYQAVVLTDTLSGCSILNTAHLLWEDHNIGLERHARLRVLAPDLSQSTFGCAPVAVRPGRSTTCTLSLRNMGSADADMVMADVYPPGGFALQDDSLWASEGVVDREEHLLRWYGPLAAGRTATLTFNLETSADPTPHTLYGVAFLDDGEEGRWERPAWLLVRPWSVYLPVVKRAD